jgi:2-polyprenyl-6-methoxyphenol hydroxylase-like FAD-dependent oxidoreductase
LQRRDCRGFDWPPEHGGRHLMSNIGGRAVVLGAGMAGLLAARVLSESFDEVCLVERDKLPDCPGHRKGVPQDRHLHNFLGAGVQVLSTLFPGILDEMAAAGAVVVADGDLSRNYARVGNCVLKRSGRLAEPAVMTMCLASRPFVEFHVRRRVSALPGVTLLDGHDAVEPLAGHDVVTGVRVIDCDTAVMRALDADWVVDAAGRSARTPSFLDREGYGRPPEERSPGVSGYSSQRLHIPTGALGAQTVMFNPGPGRPGGVLLACENDTWMLAIGRPHDAGGAPPDFATMLAIAAEALPPDIYGGLRRAEPVGEIALYRNPDAIWRRYEKVARFPRGLLVIGDALCSLNPIYGQGMTMAALHAMTLRDCLRGGDTDLAQRFFALAAQQISPVWARNQASDRVPAPKPGRPIHNRLRDRMVKATVIAACYDTTVTERILRVVHLVDPPTRLNDPALLPRIAVANLRHLRGQARGNSASPP